MAENLLRRSKLAGTKPVRFASAKVMTKLLCGLLLWTLALGAAELSGKWSGSFDVSSANGDSKSDTAYLDLREKAGEVTGTAGPKSDQQWPLRKGKLDGQKLTFEVLAGDDGALLKFELTLDGDSLQGTCSGTSPDGEKMSAKLDLKRNT